LTADFTYNIHSELALEGNDYGRKYQKFVKEGISGKIPTPWREEQDTGL